METNSSRFSNVSAELFQNFDGPFLTIFFVDILLLITLQFKVALSKTQVYGMTLQRRMERQVQVIKFFTITVLLLLTELLSKLVITKLIIYY